MKIRLWNGDILVAEADLPEGQTFNGWSFTPTSCYAIGSFLVVDEKDWVTVVELDKPVALKPGVVYVARTEE